MQLSKKYNGFDLKISTNTNIGFDFKEFPIIWKGIFNNTSIEITQKEYSNNPNDFKFSGLSYDEKNILKIIALIDMELKRILD